MTLNDIIDEIDKNEMVVLSKRTTMGLYMIETIKCKEIKFALAFSSQSYLMDCKLKFVRRDKRGNLYVCIYDHKEGEVVPPWQI